MLRRWLALPLFTGALLALTWTGSVDVGYAKPGDPKDKKEKKDKDKEPGGKAGKDITHAYEVLNDVAVLRSRGNPPRETGKLFDQAQDLYRAALRSYENDDGVRAGELGKAANDAGRGLKHWLRATLPPAVELPAPPLVAPRLPATEASVGAYEVLQRARDRLTALDPDRVVGPGKPFADTGRLLYEQARTAFSNRQYQKAVELARAAEAFAHVPEHLDRAGYPADRGSDDRPPPPPPLGDKELAPPPLKR